MVTAHIRPITERFKSPSYQLLSKIGEGGFGEVYSAKQLNTDQVVAIKFLRLDLNLPIDKKQRFIQRFDRETKLTSKLNHPNIVRLLDKGVCDQDLLYGVFEYVNGITLKQYLAQSQTIVPVQAAQIMAQVLDALAYAHQQGIVHRDIKPANIMLVQTNNSIHVKVLDFSISAVIDEQKRQQYQTITLTNETLGTPAYSAPEQLRGEPPNYKTDLYVWGLVFIECLTGKPAYTGSSSAAIFHQQLSPANVPIPTSLISHPVANLLRRVLNKNLSERTANASALYQQLTSINFATLVGKIGGQKDSPVSNESFATPHGLDEHTLYCQHTQTTDQTLHSLDNSSSKPLAISERKQLTVLCVCLEIEVLNPDNNEDPNKQEISDSLLDDQLTLCLDVANRYGGFHVGTLGDMILCYFGYPNVSDHDCRLAARAALEISSKINARNQILKQNLGLQTHKYIGLHSGVLTCHNEQIPKGDTSNTSIKLARLAEPDQILCSQHTKSQLSGFVEFEQVVHTTAHQNAHLQNIFTIEGEKQSEAIGLVSTHFTDTLFFGRQRQIQQLTAHLKPKSKNKSLAIVHVYGEPGIGKSRLIYQLRQSAPSHRHLIARCLPEQGNSALYPMLTLIKRHFGLSANNSKQSVDILNEALQTLINPEQLPQTIALLCAWFTIPIPDDNRHQQHEPQLSQSQQKQLLFKVLANLLYQSVQSQSVQSQLTSQNDSLILLIIEDIHWSDPTTLDFIASLHSNPQWQQNLLITTSRQPKPQSFTQLNLEELKLDKLSKTDAGQFISQILNSKNLNPLPIEEQLLTALIEKTDGIPLFIEQVVNMLLQENKIKEVNGFIDVTDQRQLAQLPNSLLDTLQQTLDSLIRAKETAQIAAIIGRDFDQALLAQISNISLAQLQLNLDELLDKQLIVKQRKVKGDSYLFRHALIKDAAYNSIPASIKQQHHQHLATLLKQLNAPAQQLGFHFAGAQQPIAASQYYLRAGNNAAATFAHNEYINYYYQGIEQLQKQAKIEPLSDEQLKQLSEAYQGIGDGELAKGQHDQARQAYLLAIKQLEIAKPSSEQSNQATKVKPNIPQIHRLMKAILRHKIGQSWTTDYQHQKALDAYQKALTELSLISANQRDEDYFELWLNISSARLNLYYIQGDIEQIQQQIELIEQKIKLNGNPIQQAQFLKNQYQLKLRQNRFVVDQPMLALSQKAIGLLADTQHKQLAIELAFDHALLLYFNHQHQKAFEHFLQFYQDTKSMKNVKINTLCLNYLAVCARHLGKVEQCQQFAEQTIIEGKKAQLNDYIGAATANLAWVSYKKTTTEKAEVHQSDDKKYQEDIDSQLSQAAQLWQNSMYPMQWQGLLLQLDKHCTNKDMNNEKCLSKTDATLNTIINTLLEPSQQCLPALISAPLQQALEMQSSKTSLQSNNNPFHLRLQQVIQNAKLLGYL